MNNRDMLDAMLADVQFIDRNISAMNESTISEVLADLIRITQLLKDNVDGDIPKQLPF